MLKPSVRISSLSLSSRVAGSALGRPALRAPTPWICASCLRRPLARASSLQLKKSFSSSLGARQDDGQLKAASGTSWAPSDTKPFYVTTPIFYVNASPHVGHLYTMVLADVLKRWHLLLGRDAKLLTGTDEHGMKVQRAAQDAGVDVKTFCDGYYEQFEKLANAAGVSFDRFIRTTDKDHKRAVEHFWTMLNHRGHIYESKHEGWYSVSDETFYPQTQVQLTLDPATGRKIMTSIETGKQVEWTSETNYHFRLSAFKDRLLEYYKQNPEWIVPATRMDEIMTAVSSGLQDLSISRPSERLTWGIPVPGDSSQTIYVWLDALINYITMAGYPFTPGQEVKSIWPADVQVIGKDITRFHCIYWPAFLMALDLPLPTKMLTHAHWTMNKAKMSKSSGNGVNPFFAIDRFGREPIRYFLAHDGGIANDTDYDNSLIMDKYKKGLHGGLGNLLARVTRGKKWNVRESVEAAAKRINEVGSSSLEAKAQAERIRELPEKVKAEFDLLNSRGALHAIMNVVYETNKYIHEAAPWDLVASSEPDAQLAVHEIIFLTSEALRVCGILLQPFMPERSARMLDVLGVEEGLGSRGFQAAQYGADTNFGIPRVPIGKGREGVLFAALTEV